MPLNFKISRRFIFNKYVLIILGVLVFLAITRSFMTIVPPAASTKGLLITLEWRIKTYVKDNGELPPSLSILPERPGYHNSIKDGWGKEIIYKRDLDGSVMLMSFGGDGKPGGTGEDSDISKTFRIEP